MAKKQDFASKVAKAQKSGDTCPVCGDVYSFVKKEQAYFSDATQSWKYEMKNHKLCKCNEKEIFG